ncbi:hypothetical protein JOM56_002800 [Amanita muscaria]
MLLSRVENKIQDTSSKLLVLVIDGMFVSYHKTNFSVGNVHIGRNPLQMPASAHTSSHGNNYRLHFPLLGQRPKPSSLIGSPAAEMSTTQRYTCQITRGIEATIKAFCSPMLGPRSGSQHRRLHTFSSLSRSTYLALQVFETLYYLRFWRRNRLEYLLPNLKSRKSNVPRACCSLLRHETTENAYFLHLRKYFRSQPQYIIVD